MPISIISEMTGYSFRGGGVGADLTAPANPTPVNLSAGSTALPSTLIGSWSAPVTVVAACTTGSGAPGPTVTVTGSGAGPYSVAIASGLTTATSYIVTIEGTGTDGQIAETCLLVIVAGVVGDLTAPVAPPPSNLPAGSTALGSTLIGSWSASVTVSALVLASSGPVPTATITGSGAGPYSISIASGLSDATSYLVILTGTGIDGQVASTSLLVAVAPPADLTAPASPAPVSLAAGTTTLGTTALGSWSASVSVAATAAGSDGSTPAVTLTGSGAGPYSVAVAGGLADGVTYTVTAAGTGTDGQVSRTALAVAVRNPATVLGTLQWQVLTDWDFTTVDTAAAFTTSGALALTTGGGSPFLTITTYTPSGSGTGSITPTNGVGLVVATTSTFQRAFYFQPSMAGITQGRQRYAVEWIHTLSSIATGGLVLPSLGTTTSVNSGKQYGQGTVRDGANVYNMRVRNRDGAGTISGSNVVTSATLFAAYRAVQIMSPGGGQAFLENSSTPTGPESSGVEQYSAVEVAPGSSPILQNPYIHVSYGVAAVTATLTRIRLWREVVA